MSFPLTSSSLSIPSSSSSSSSSGSQILSYPHSPSIPVSQLFTRKELVGKGAYGGVYKGIHNPTGQVVALKVIDLDTPEDDISEIQKEVAVLSEFRNEDAIKYNVTAYHGCYLNGYELWIAMDFASGGSIRTLMKCGPIEEKYAALIVREVLVALSFLHRQDIIHRDVKAANILLTQTGKILLCDFGVAAHLQMSNSGKRSTFTGTPLWMAPEVITDGKLYDTKADIWSLGITLYEIIVGNPPHFGIEPLRACAIIPTSQPPTLPEQFQNQTSSQMREFLSSCLMVDPTDRPSAEELSKTKWIKSASKLPMVLLRELIVRYVSWIQSGGQRTSIVGTLPGSSGGLGGSEEDLVQREDTFELTGQREEGWDFDLDEQDFSAVQLGLGPSTGEGLGDEPNYRASGRGGGGGGMMMSLDELAAKSNLRPPKQQSQPPPASSSSNRNHPLLRLFDEESNPYAQPNPLTSSSSSSNPLISLLPSSSLNTLKPTISLPSFDTLENSSSSSDQIDLGISLPSFGDNGSSAFGGGFGNNSSSSGYGGAGWGGAGWNNQIQYNDAFNSSGTGSSPFDTIGPSENFGSGITIQGEEEEDFDVEIGGGGGGTVRGFSSRRGGISEDHTVGGGRGGGGVQQVQDSISSSSKSGGDQFERKEEEEEEEVDTWGKGKKEMTQGGGDRDRDENGIPGFGGLGNGFKFGGTRTITIDTSPLVVAAEEEEEVSTPTLAKTNFANKDSETIPTPPLRKRADTAPSFNTTTTQVQTNVAGGGGGGGGYPPLGRGLPRNENGKVGGYPPLGVGLPRSANLSIVETREEDGEEQEEGVGINRPFGGGSNLNRSFQFGGNRGRAATMLNNNNSNSSERPIIKFEAGSGVGGDRKRSESDSNKRQGLTITTGGISGASSSTTGGRSLNSPSPASASSPSISSSIPHGQPPKHKRQASSLSTHSYTAPSPDSSESSHHHHRSNQLSTSSSSTSSNSTILLTTSPTSSLSISSQQQKSITLSGRGEGEGDGEYKDQQQQLATPLAAQPQQSRNEGNGNGDNRDVVDEKEVLMMNNTAIGFPFPPVGDLLVPTTSSSSNQLPSVSQEEEGEEEYIYEEEEVEEIIPLSIKPLDYSILKDRSTVEKELELVLEGLGDWFKIVREGLEKVLEDSGGTEGGGGVEQQQEGRREFIVGLDLRGTIEGIQVK